MRSNTKAVLVALLLSLVWFAPYLVPGRALLGVHPALFEPFSSAVAPEVARAARTEGRLLYTDKLLQHHPEVLHTVRGVQRGELPAWNPWVLGGLPHIATGLPSALYPPLWISFWIDPPYCYVWLAILQTALGAWFTLGLLRAFGLSPVAAGCGGLLFAASGWMSVHQEYFQLTAPATWLPLALWGTHRLLEGRGGTLRLGLALGFSFLSGFPQIAVFTGLACALLAGFTLVERFRKAEWGMAKLLGVAGHFALACVLGIALAAPQLLATAELVAGGHSTREPLTAETLEQHALPPGALIGGVLPDLLGNDGFSERLENPAYGSLYGVWLAKTLDPDNTTNLFERSWYLGPATLLLALIGLFLGRCGARGFFALLAGLSLALVLPGPLLRGAAHVPGLDIGDPKRSLLLLSFATLGLAALGLDAFLRAARRRRRILLALLFGCAVLLTGAWVLTGSLEDQTLRDFLVPRLAQSTGLAPEEVSAAISDGDLRAHRDLLREELGLATAFLLLAASMLALAIDPRAKDQATIGRARAAGLGLALLVPLGWFWLRVDTPQRTADLMNRPPLLEHLRTQGQGGRLLRLDPLALAPIPPLPPKLPMLHQVSDAQGYVAVYLRHWREIFEGLEPGCTETVGIRPLKDLALLERPVLDALGVEFALLPLPLESTEVPAVPGWSPEIAPGRLGTEVPYRIQLLHNDEFLGRAWIVQNARVFASEETLLAYLLSDAFAPAGEALVLQEDVAPLLKESHRTALASDPAQGVRLTLASWEERAAGPARLLSREQPRTPATATARLLQSGDQELVFEVESKGGVLVQSGCHYPGWAVEIDGQEHPLLRVDHALRGVLLRPGRHQVRFVYRPLPLYLGGFLAPAALLLLLILASWRRPHPSPDPAP